MKENYSAAQTWLMFIFVFVLLSSSGFFSPAHRAICCRDSSVIILPIDETQSETKQTEISPPQVVGSALRNVPAFNMRQNNLFHMEQGYWDFFISLNL